MGLNITLCAEIGTTVPSINEIKKEAEFFRKLIDQCDKENTELVIDCFPIMSCKLTSMLLAYHLFSIYSDIKIIGIGGEALDNNGDETISHYWLEVNEFAVDITGDQYNLINANELNKEIVKNRPFQSVYVADKKDSILYKLFYTTYQDSFDKKFSSVKSSFLWSMQQGHKQLIKNS